MLRWLRPHQKKPKRSQVQRQRTILQVEDLEGRDCPSAPPITPQVGTVSATATPTHQAPVIVNFQAINNGSNSWTFTGQVQDASAAGLVVQLRGIPTLNNNNASATVQANGTFSYTISLQPGERGCVTAVCTDWWGQTSNQATAFVSN